VLYTSIFYWNVTKYFRKWTGFKHVHRSAGISPCPMHYTHYVSVLTLPTTCTHLNTQQALINVHEEKNRTCLHKRVCRTLKVPASIDRPHWLLLIPNPVLLLIHSKLCRYICKEGNCVTSWMIMLQMYRRTQTSYPQQEVYKEIRNDLKSVKHNWSSCIRQVYKRC